MFTVGTPRSRASDAHTLRLVEAIKSSCDTSSTETNNASAAIMGTPNYRKDNVITEKSEGVRCREKPNVPSGISFPIELFDYDVIM